MSQYDTNAGQQSHTTCTRAFQNCPTKLEPFPNRILHGSSSPHNGYLFGTQKVGFVVAKTFLGGEFIDAFVFLSFMELLSQINKKNIEYASKKSHQFFFYQYETRNHIANQ